MASYRKIHIGLLEPLSLSSLHNHDNRDAFQITPPHPQVSQCGRYLLLTLLEIHLNYCKVEIWRIKLLHESKDLVIVNPDTSLWDWWQKTSRNFTLVENWPCYYCTSETDSQSLLKSECMFTHNLGEQEPKAHFHLWHHPPFETISVIAHICNHTPRPSWICSER